MISCPSRKIRFDKALSSAIVLGLLAWIFLQAQLIVYAAEINAMTSVSRRSGGTGNWSAAAVPDMGEALVCSWPGILSAEAPSC